ncbi:hypothetical protein BCR36DRAFT_411481 [Piromyces finnis]|uniref:Uncharacterized protein n=1 Tax=Piromyces finnis TaxID=1754191 RepID=A0A1Y1VC98_9FUNG|nr:hypothetical protein BCR36DRAFT_411481 [Piromyces finnis]|eukprot:ORX52592.1 hypothetical protein BCR36DRAFT_411481 [Piromyces finnis]
MNIRYTLINIIKEYYKNYKSLEYTDTHLTCYSDRDFFKGHKSQKNIIKNLNEMKKKCKKPLSLTKNEEYLKRIPYIESNSEGVKFTKEACEGFEFLWLVRLNVTSRNDETIAKISSKITKMSIHDLDRSMKLYNLMELKKEIMISPNTNKKKGFYIYHFITFTKVPSDISYDNIGNNYDSQNINTDFNPNSGYGSLNTLNLLEPQNNFSNNQTFTKVPSDNSSLTSHININTINLDNDYNITVMNPNLLYTVYNINNTNDSKDTYNIIDPNVYYHYFPNQEIIKKFYQYYFQLFLLQILFIFHHPNNNYV